MITAIQLSEETVRQCAEGAPDGTCYSCMATEIECLEYLLEILRVESKEETPDG